MAVLLRGGIPVGKSLDILSRQGEDKNFHLALVGIKKNIENGQSFSSALLKSSCSFPKTYIAVVQAGENSGMLVQCLEKINIFLEKEIYLVKKVRSSLTYPIIMLGVSLILVFAIVKFVFPIFLKMFGEMHATLPLITRIVLLLVKFFQSPAGWIFVIAFIAILLLLKKILSRSSQWQDKLDQLKLKLPVVGEIYVKIASTQFCRMLASLYANGVPVRKCLTLSAEAIGNKVFEREIQRIEKDLVSGIKISESLREGNLFPKPVIQMVAVGESTGELMKVLNKVSDYYDKEVDGALEALTVLLEPLIIVFLGAVMGTFMISIFLPLYQLLGSLNQ